MAETDTSGTINRQARSEHPIVVGIDGSEESSAALAFAYREAELRNVELHAVHAWQLPTQWFPRYAPEKWLRGEVERDAHKYVHEFLGRKEAPHWLKVRVIQGHPAAVLLAKAEEAQLLVVGSRGRSGVKPLLLGSVSSACVHHASCPVAVVRARTSGSS